MTKLQMLKRHVIDLLAEGSTWRSIMFFITLATGYQLQWPEEHQLFAATSMAYLVGLFLKDKVK